MRKIFAYIPLLIFLFACSNEEDFTGQQGTPSTDGTVEMPVVISLSGNTGKEMRTRANEGASTDRVYQPSVPGTANVDKVKLYVFKCDRPSFEDEIKAEEYTFDSSMELTDFADASSGSITIKHDEKEISLPVHNGDRVAVGNITLDANLYYVIWAVAYDKSQESWFNIPIAENNKLSDLKVQLTGNTTPELFAGCLYYNEQDETVNREEQQEFSTSRPISGFNESMLLFGQLYRSVGRVSVTLKGIPEGIDEISFVSSIFPTSLIAFNKWFVDNATDPFKYCYPMGYCNEKLSTTNTKVATATVEAKAGEERTATVSSFFLPFNDTSESGVATKIKNRAYFYIEAGGQQYMVKCADTTEGELPTIWSQLYEVLVSQNTFIVPVNWDIRISGDFETLKQGNLKIDLSEMGKETIGPLE